MAALWPRARGYAEGARRCALPFMKNITHASAHTSGTPPVSADNRGPHNITAPQNYSSGQWVKKKRQHGTRHKTEGAVGGASTFMRHKRCGRGWDGAVRRGQQQEGWTE